jgi:WD40 repeat protein
MKRRGHALRMGLFGVIAACIALAGSCAAVNAQTGDTKTPPNAGLGGGKERAEKIGTLKGAVGPLAFHPKKNILATCGDYRVKFWSIPDCKSIGVADGVAVFTFAFSPDGETIAAGGGGGSIPASGGLFSVPDGKMLTKYRANGRVACYAFSPDGKFLASGEFRGRVPVWSLPGAKPWTNYYPKKTADKIDVYEIEFSPDGKIVASADNNGAVSLWSVADKKLLQRLVAPDYQLGSAAPGLAFSNYGNRPSLIVTGWDRLYFEGKVVKTEQEMKTVRKNGFKNLKVKNLVRVHWLEDKKPSLDLDFDRDARLVISRQEGLIAAIGKGKIQIVRAHGNEVIGTWDGYKDDSNINGAFSPNGRVLAVWQGKSVKLFSVPDGKLMATLNSDAGAVSDLAFAPDNRTLAFAGIDGPVAVWTYGEASK